jgi:glycerol-3-phosphate dehydrogenase (NAD(P)+)
VRTARAAGTLASRAGVAVPITREVSAVLFEGKAPEAALASLLERDVRPEEETATFDHAASPGVPSPG